MEEESSIMSKGDTSFELSDSSTIDIDTDTADYFNGIFTILFHLQMEQILCFITSHYLIM